MRKIKLGALMLGTALALGVGAGLALSNQRVNVVEAEATTHNFTLSSAAAVTDGNVTVTFAKASGSTAPAWYANGLRLYASNTITVTASNGDAIKSVSFNWEKQGSKAFNTATADVGTYTHPTSAGTGTWTGDETSVVFTLGSNGQLQLNTFSVVSDAATGVSLSFDSEKDYEIGDEGTFAASTNGTNPTYAWSGDNDAVMTVSAAGAYHAYKSGVCNVTVTVTATEGSKTLTVPVAVSGETYTVAQAIAVAATFDNSKDTKTSYYVNVTAYITSLDESISGGNPRAINVSDNKLASATDSDTIMVYGVYSNYAVRKYAVLNGQITVRAQIENRNGSYQLALSGVSSILDYTDEAEAFAKTAYTALQEACNTGVQAVTEEVWNALAAQYENVDEYAQAKLKAADVSEYREDITKWVARYELIVNNSNLDDFMERGLVNAAISSNINHNNNGGIIALIVIAAVASVSLASVVTIIVIKRKIAR